MKNYTARKKFIVLDTETANGLDDPLVYDIGYIVADKYGHIYRERSFIITDIFQQRSDLMDTAYYANKIPQYLESLSRGECQAVSLYTAQKTLRDDMAEFGCKEVYAYNAKFDVNALNTTQRYLTKSKYRYFFPYGTQIKCIWNMACQVLTTQKSFYHVAAANGWYSPAGNWQTSAETLYRYITGEHEFAEEHKGLDDVRIEYAILLKCLRQKKAMETCIRRNCWKIPVDKWGKAKKIS